MFSLPLSLLPLFFTDPIMVLVLDLCNWSMVKKTYNHPTNNITYVYFVRSQLFQKIKLLGEDSWIVFQTCRLTQKVIGLEGPLIREIFCIGLSGWAQELHKDHYKYFRKEWKTSIGCAHDITSVQSSSFYCLYSPMKCVYMLDVYTLETKVRVLHIFIFMLLLLQMISF